MENIVPARYAAMDDTMQRLLARLHELHIQLRAARATAVSLEADLAMAEKKYREALEPLLNQVAALQHDLDMLSDSGQLEDGVGSGVPDPNGDPGRNRSPNLMKARMGKDSDEVDKDELLEHLFDVLDTTVNKQDAELLGKMEGLCQNPSLKLGDVLEQLDWGPVWEAQGSEEHENPASQYRRLKTWERALERQVATVTQAAEDLQRGPRFTVWEYYAKGEAAWQTYLQPAIERLQRQRDALRDALQNQRQETS